MERLNDNDQKLLAYCWHMPQSINDIARYLKITPASASVKVQKLKEKKHVKITDHGKGKKKMVRTIQGDKTLQYMIQILQKIKEKGSVTMEEYSVLLPPDPADPTEYDKMTATNRLMWSVPKMVEKTISLTEEGEKFLKEHHKK